MSCPPTKRPRRLNDDVAMASDDPFGDDEFFTQDDLDEIDDITSQAFPQGAPSGLNSKLASRGTQLTPNSYMVFRAAQICEQSYGWLQQIQHIWFQQLWQRAAKQRTPGWVQTQESQKCPTEIHSLS